MNSRIQAKFNIQGANEWLDALQKNVAEKVAKYTVADIGRRVLSALLDAFSEGYTIKRSKIDLKMRTQSQNGLAVVISGKKREKSLSNYELQQVPGGVIAEVRRGSYQFYEGGFLKTVATPATGRPYTGVFRGVRDSNGKSKLKIVYYAVSYGNLLKSQWAQDVALSTVGKVKDAIFAQKIRDIGLK